MPIKFKSCMAPPAGCGQSKMLVEFWKDPKEPDGHAKRCAACVKDRRRERAEARANGEEVLAYSEERRAELSQRAADLHAQGKLGGSQYGRLGGRPRKARIADAVLEHFRDPKKMGLIVGAYEAALRSRNRSLSLRAAEALNNLEHEEERHAREARGAGKDPSEMSPEELEEFLVQGIAGMIERGELNTETINLPASAVTEVV